MEGCLYIPLYISGVREWAWNFIKSQQTSRNACQRTNSNRNEGEMKHDERVPLFSSIQTVQTVVLVMHKTWTYRGTRWQATFFNHSTRYVLRYYALYEYCCRALIVYGTLVSQVVLVPGRTAVVIHYKRKYSGCTNCSDRDAQNMNL